MHFNINIPLKNSLEIKKTKLNIRDFYCTAQVHFKSVWHYIFFMENSYNQYRRVADIAVVNKRNT